MSAAALLTPLGAFAAGLGGSVGPCAAPRYVALAGLAAGAPFRRRVSRTALFVGGLACGYAVLGSCAGALARIAAGAAFAYGLLAVALGAFGLAALLREPGQHACRHEASGARGAFGGPFLLGGSFALVASPCCTPVVAFFAAVGAAGGDGRAVALALGAFVLGHVLPLAAAAFGSNLFGEAFASPAAAPAMRTLGGALMLAMAGYYALLV